MKFKEYFLYLAFFQALIGMIMSLVYSEVLHVIPCVLCWYQRILLYPLVIILGIGISKKDKNMPTYVLPFSILGVIFATYHYLLQLGIITEKILPCTAGVSCSAKTVEYFGFVTIPLLSLLAFAFISLCMVIYLHKSKEIKK